MIETYCQKIIRGRGVSGEHVWMQRSSEADYPASRGDTICIGEQVLVAENRYYRKGKSKVICRQNVDSLGNVAKYKKIIEAYLKEGWEQVDGPHD